jgi:nicotinamidase-related amidase
MIKKSGSEHGGGRALLIIDVQRGLFNRATPVYQAEALIQNINTLVDRAHDAGVPVFYVQHSNDSSLVEGSDNWKLHPAMQPTLIDTLIHKRHGSAFVDTPLGKELSSRGVDGLIITGLVSQGCVRATSLDALKLGYEVNLVEDAHSTYSKTAKRIIRDWNKKLSNKGAALVRTEAVDLR